MQCWVVKLITSHLMFCVGKMTGEAISYRPRFYFKYSLGKFWNVFLSSNYIDRSNSLLILIYLFTVNLDFFAVRQLHYCLSPLRGSSVQKEEAKKPEMILLLRKGSLPQHNKQHGGDSGRNEPRNGPIGVVSFNLRSGY